MLLCRSGSALANATTFTDTTIVANQAYSYEVVAYNVAGDGPASNALGLVGISSVSTTTATGAYNAGNTITITIGFTGNVTVTGIPTLALNTIGGWLGTATYPSGCGTSTLTFTYTVAP